MAAERHCITQRRATDRRGDFRKVTSSKQKRIPPMGSGEIHIHADFRLFDVDIRDSSCSNQALKWSKAAKECKTHGYFSEGILLKSLERSREYISRRLCDKRDDFHFAIVNNPFMDSNIPEGPVKAMFPSVGMTFCDVSRLCPARSTPAPDHISVITGEPLPTRSDHTDCTQARCGVYEEEESIGKDGTPPLPKCPQSANTVYYLMAFKTQENATGLTLTWRTWTGADFILWKCPKDLGLQRLSFYKHLRPGVDDVMFFLLIECAEGLANQEAAFHFLERLRDRRCGHVGLYKVDKIY